jgi:diguanylate cyclase (GGDEF)-like protein
VIGMAVAVTVPEQRPCGSPAASRVSAAHRIVLLTAAIAVAAAVLFSLVVTQLPGLDVPVGLPWPVWVAAFAVADILIVHVQVHRDHHSLSLTDLVLVAGLFLMDPSYLVMAQLAGAAWALVLHRRQSGLKLAFNLAQFALTGSLAAALFGVLVRGSAWSDPWAWFAAVVAVAVATLTAGLCIFTAMALSHGTVGFVELGRMLRLSMPFAIGVAALGILATYTALVNPVALGLLALPSVLLIASYRAYTHAHEQQQNLRLLHETTSLLYNSEDPTVALTDFLTAVRGGFRAALAELILFGGEADTATTVSRSREGQEPLALWPVEDSADAGLLVDAATATGMFTARTAKATGMFTARTATAAGSHLDEYVQQRGLKDAMVAVLRTEDRVHGLLIVGDRLGEVSTFTAADVALLETFARHLATSLERGRLEHNLRQVTELKEKLRHQAMHDALTGLPNRTLFLDRAQHALHLAERNGLWPAVLYIDLDGFKPINDTYGHEAGDALLRAFAQRLSHCVRAADTAARLGGDEFAVLLHGPIDRDGVERVIGRIRTELNLPVDLGAGRTGTVGASIGVAMTATSTDVDSLIRDADAAMYHAKRRGDNSSIFYDDTHRDPIAEPVRLSVAAPTHVRGLAGWGLPH